MRLVPQNKAITTDAPPAQCYRYHRDYAAATCPECKLQIPGGPYDAAQFSKYFHTPMQAQTHVDIGRAGDATPSHDAARVALELADAAHRAAAARLGDLGRRIDAARSQSDLDRLQADETVIHESLREASENAQKARVRFNAEDRQRGQRILAATAKAEGRS